MILFAISAPIAPHLSVELQLSALISMTSYLEFQYVAAEMSYPILFSCFRTDYSGNRSPHSFHTVSTSSINQFVVMTSNGYLLREVENKTCLLNLILMKGSELEYKPTQL